MTSFPKARSEASCLAFLRAIDTAESDAFRVLVVQDFERVAVEDRNDGAGEVDGTDRCWDEQRYQ